MCPLLPWQLHSPGGCLQQRQQAVRAMHRCRKLGIAPHAAPASAPRAGGLLMLLSWECGRVLGAHAPLHLVLHYTPVLCKPPNLKRIINATQ
jgi:hypothetical protein